MKCWGLWYGGNSYVSPTFEDMEEFNSIQHAKNVVEGRYEGDDGSGMRTPAVDDSSEMHLYLTAPDKLNDTYPDKIIKFGPRGGIIVIEA